MQSSTTNSQAAQPVKKSVFNRVENLSRLISKKTGVPRNNDRAPARQITHSGQSSSSRGTTSEVRSAQARMQTHDQPNFDSVAQEQEQVPYRRNVTEYSNRITVEEEPLNEEAKIPFTHGASSVRHHMQNFHPPQRQQPVMVTSPTSANEIIAFQSQTSQVMSEEDEAIENLDKAANIRSKALNFNAGSYTRSATAQARSPIESFPDKMAIPEHYVFASSRRSPGRLNNEERKLVVEDVEQSRVSLSPQEVLHLTMKKYDTMPPKTDSLHPTPLQIKQANLSKGLAKFVSTDGNPSMRQKTTKNQYHNVNDSERESISPQIKLLSKNMDSETSSHPQNLRMKKSSERITQQPTTGGRRQEPDNFYTSEKKSSFQSSVTTSPGFHPSGYNKQSMQEFEELKRNLEPEEPCIIKQGGKTYNVSPDVINQILLYAQKQQSSSEAAGQAMGSERVEPSPSETGITPKADFLQFDQPAISPVKMLHNLNANGLSPKPVTHPDMSFNNPVEGQPHTPDNVTDSQYSSSHVENMDGSQTVRDDATLMNQFQQNINKLQVPGFMARSISAKTTSPFKMQTQNMLADSKKTQTPSDNQKSQNKTPFQTPNQKKGSDQITIFSSNNKKSPEREAPLDFTIQGGELSNILRPSVVSKNENSTINLWADLVDNNNLSSAGKPQSTNNVEEEKKQSEFPYVEMDKEESEEDFYAKMERELAASFPQEIAINQPGVPANLIIPPLPKKDIPNPHVIAAKEIVPQMEQSEEDEYEKLERELAADLAKDLDSSLSPGGGFAPLPLGASRLPGLPSGGKPLPFALPPLPATSKGGNSNNIANIFMPKVLMNKSKSSIHASVEKKQEQEGPKEKFQNEAIHQEPQIFMKRVMSAGDRDDGPVQPHTNRHSESHLDERSMTHHLGQIPEYSIESETVNGDFEYLMMHQDTGISQFDKIERFASLHKVDPSMYCSKDNDQAEKAVKDFITKRLTPRNGRGQQKEQPDKFLKESNSLSQTISEIRSRIQRASINQVDSGRQIINRFSDLSQKAFNPPASPHIPMRKLSVNTSKQQRNQRDILEDVIQQLELETISNTAQISVLSLSLKRFLRNNDKNNVIQINKQIRSLKQQENKMQEIMNIFKVQKKELQFAFLFASPLYFQKSEKGFTHFKPLDFMKEFLKIRDSINAAGVAIKITKRQCTQDSIQKVLAMNPLGLHFSGHGILNSQDNLGADFYEQNKDQGDFLVLENDIGGSELVSREQLKKMIKQNKCELDFVFVATCHSEFVGRIFQQAGVKHVICIKHQNTVGDQSIITFTDTFYTMVIEQNNDICTAFKQAQLSVEISFNQTEANIFQLLLKDDEASHQCSTFGPFQEGKCTQVHPYHVPLANRAPRMSKLRGREKDMTKLMEKILRNPDSRLINLLGLSGAGKSALVASMLEYISERSLLKGGSIYFNARNIQMVEIFIRNLNQVLLSENPLMFGIAKESDLANPSPVKTLQLILSKIDTIDGEVLLVIDNAEELIENDRNDFSVLICMILTRVSNFKVLLTSQVPLRQSGEYKEEKQILGNLAPNHSVQLFIEMTGKGLYQDEINNLLAIRADAQKYPEHYIMYPEQKFKDPRKLTQHHLFTLLNGVPQSIILVASLLADPQKKLTLRQLYQMLTDDNLFEQLKKEGDGHEYRLSLTLSAGISFQAVEEKDPENIELLHLLALLPGGVSPDDLDLLWGSMQQVTKQNFQKLDGRSSGGGLGENISNCQVSNRSRAVGGANPITIQVTKSKDWKRAFAELHKSNLALSKKAPRRFFNTTSDDQYMRKTTETVLSESLIDSPLEEGEDGIVILLPKIVRNFAEGKETEEKSDFFLQVLGNWYKNLLHSIYIKNDNTVFSASNANKARSNLSREFGSLEENLNVFISRMLEKYQKPTNQFASLQKYSGPVQMNKLEDDSSLESDLDEGSFITLTEKRIESGSTSVVTEPGLNGRINRRSTPNPSSFLNEVRQERQEDEGGPTNCPELFEAYKDVKLKKPILEKFIEQMKPRKMLHPKQTADRDEKATQYWRWAFERVIQNMREKKRIDFQQLNIVDDNLEKSFDSDQDVKEDTMQKAMHNYSMEANNNRLTRIGTRKKLNEQFTKQNTATLKIPRGSIKGLNNNNYARQTSRMSAFEQRKATMVTKTRQQLNEDELTMIYYLANLILLTQNNVANLLIKKYYKKMKECSPIFKANVHRFQSLLLSRMYDENQNKRKDTTKYFTRADKQKIDKDLQKNLQGAEKHFMSVKCAQGLGLTYYQQALELVHRIDRDCSADGICFQSLRSDDLVKSSSKLHLLEQGIREGVKGKIEIAKKLFGQAIDQFLIISHWRGLYNSNRHLERLTSLESALPDSAQKTLEKDRQHRDQIRLQRDYLNRYDQHRSQYANEKDHCIQRNGGEDISLLTEIVTMVNTDEWFDEEKSDFSKSFKTDTSMADVLESDNESSQSQSTRNIVPQIQIDTFENETKPQANPLMGLLSGPDTLRTPHAKTGKSTEKEESLLFEVQTEFYRKRTQSVRDHQ